MYVYMSVESASRCNRLDLTHYVSRWRRKKVSKNEEKNQTKQFEKKNVYEISFWIFDLKLNWRNFSVMIQKKESCDEYSILYCKRCGRMIVCIRITSTRIYRSQRNLCVYVFMLFCIFRLFSHTHGQNNNTFDSFYFTTINDFELWTVNLIKSKRNNTVNNV